MKIERKAFYTKKITVQIEPHEVDIKFGFLTEMKVEHLKMPCTFLAGKEFNIYYSCLSCDGEIVLTSAIITSQIGKLNLSYLMTGKLRKPSFLESICDIFPNIKKRYSNSNCYLESDNIHGTFRLFQVKCPLCKAKYLGIYIERAAEIPDRPGPKLAPAQVYLDNIAWVEFDEDEFFKEAGIR